MPDSFSVIRNTATVGGECIIQCYICALVQDLRNVEKEVRNLAAHEVECIF